jgi:hypothetical protein
MKIAIMQPTYLPWLGYFDLADDVDLFVLLDNVQFVKRSWQQRNRVKTAAGLAWLTVPVNVSGRYHQRITEASISDASFVDAHLRTVAHNYSKAPNYKDRYAPFGDALKRGAATGSLAELNIGLIRFLFDALGVKTPLARATAIGVEGRRTELLAQICRSTGASQYLSPLGSAVYLLDEARMLQDGGVEVLFQHYEHPIYSQLFPPFLPYASAVDLLLNEGPRSLEVIRWGRRPAYNLDEVRAVLPKEVEIDG